MISKCISPNCERWHSSKKLKQYHPLKYHVWDFLSLKIKIESEEVFNISEEALLDPKKKFQKMLSTF